MANKGKSTKKATKAKDSKPSSEMLIKGSTKDKLMDYKEKIANAMVGGGEKRIQDQHDKGKFTARERIDRVLDRQAGK